MSTEVGVALILGLTTLVAEAMLLMTRRSDNSYVDRTLVWSWVLIVGGMVVAVPLCAMGVPAVFSYQPYEFDYVLIFFGTFLGWVFRVWSIRYLGKAFTVDVATHEDQWIAQDGPFTYIRHPSYTGLFLVLASFSFSLCNFIAPCIIIPVTLLALRQRILEEERVLAITFPVYRMYMRRTWRLLPYLW